MKLERYIPTNGLQPSVKAFMLVESQAGMVSNILPGTSVTLAFRCAGTVADVADAARDSLPVSVITGLRKTARQLEYAKDTATLVVQFSDTGAAAFFREPLHELFGVSVALDALIPRRKLDEVEDRLAAAGSSARRFAVVEHFLLAQLQAPDADRLIGKAVEDIQCAHGDIRIKDLVAGFPISQDAFEKRFNRVVGTSPKQYARIVRLRSLIDHYRPTSSLTDAALAAGYFDQAHFIKDFKAFTGKTPTAFFQSPAFW